MNTERLACGSSLVSVYLVWLVVTVDGLEKKRVLRVFLFDRGSYVA